MRVEHKLVFKSQGLHQADLRLGKVGLWFVAFLSLLVSSPASAMPQPQAQVNYAVSGETAYVTSSPNASGNVVINSTYNGFPVTSINSAAFFACSNLTNVTIPYSVTSIGSAAFNGCGLTSVTIPGNVTSIGNQAFDFCESLTNINVQVGNPAYSSMGGVLFSSNMTTLFEYPGGLSGSYVVPSSVTTIGPYAFDECFKVTSVTIPGSVLTIGTVPFSQCLSLTNINVMEDNPAYSSMGGVLFDKNMATLINFPAGLGGSYAIPGVTIIGDEAFFGCRLTDVTIPSTVLTIGYGAFLGCSGLINVAGGNPAFSSQGGVLFDNKVTTLLAFPTSLGGSYAIPGGVASIAFGAFWGCSNLTRVTFPSSLTSIGQASFYSCTSLTNLTFFGNAPALYPNEFSNDLVPGTVYYYNGTSGWGSTYGGLPTAAVGTVPQIGGNGNNGSVGVQSGGFGFPVSGVINQTIVIEMSTNFVNWQPIWTNTLTSTSTNFIDLQWTNSSSRFYRAMSEPAGISPTPVKTKKRSRNQVNCSRS